MSVSTYLFINLDLKQTHGCGARDEFPPLRERPRVHVHVVSNDGVRILVPREKQRAPTQEVDLSRHLPLCPIAAAACLLRYPRLRVYTETRYLPLQPHYAVGTEHEATVRVHPQRRAGTLGAVEER